MRPCHINNLLVQTRSGEKLVGPLSTTFTPGSITLLIGASGSGKSTVGRLLAGFAGDVRQYRQISGTVSYGGNDYDLSRDNPRPGTMVWQAGALFDDLSVAENLAITASHGQTRIPAGQLRALLDGIPHDAKVTLLSGGQRQRVAIARGLYAEADLLILDEPNAGLDPIAMAKLTAALKELKKQGNRAILIIGHHLEALLPITDTVLMIRPEDGACVTLPSESTQIDKAFLAEPDISPTLSPPEKKPAPQERRKASWWFYFFWRYWVQLMLTPSALGYALLGAGVVGFVSIWFLFAHLPYKAVLGTLLHDQILQGLGYGQARILLPLILSLLLAARNGAVIAADMGHRVYGQQIQAMRNLNIPSFVYLDLNIVIVNLTAFVVLAYAGFGVGAYISLKTWAFIHPDAPVALFQDNFMALLPGLSIAAWPDLAWITGKLALSGAATAVIALILGRRRKQSVHDINQAVAGTIIGAVIAVLAIHTFAALLEFEA